VLGRVSRIVVVLARGQVVLVDASPDEDGGPADAIGACNVRLGVVADHVEVGQLDALLLGSGAHLLLNELVVESDGLTVLLDGDLLTKGLLYHSLQHNLFGLGPQANCGMGR